MEKKYEMPAITQTKLKELIHYDPETGIFTRMVSTSSRARIGCVAGRSGKHDYIRITVDGKLYFAHRLAFLYMTGRFPLALVDHVNRNKLDNRWCNLREATNRQNACNQGLKANNTSGVIGVYWNKKSGKWLAQCRVNGNRRHLGVFEDLELAELVATEARAKYHGDFACQK